MHIRHPGFAALLACILLPTALMSACSRSASTTDDPARTAPANGLQLRIGSATSCLYCKDVVHNGTHLYLEPRSIATSVDIDHIALSRDPYTGGPSILIAFKPDAARRILWFTSKQVGKPIVWVRDGRIITVANLNEPIGAGSVLTGLGESEALAIHAALTGGHAHR